MNNRIQGGVEIGKCFSFKVDFFKSLSFASRDYFEYPPAHQAVAPKGSAA